MTTHEDSIQAYAALHTTPEPPLLAQLTRETHLQLLMPRMSSGHVQGRLLSTLSHLMRPQRILEIGTFCGYATLCLAEGLADDGVLITLEKDDELESFARSYWNQSPVGHLSLACPRLLHLCRRARRTPLARLGEGVPLNLLAEADVERFLGAVGGRPEPDDSVIAGKPVGEVAELGF